MNIISWYTFTLLSQNFQIFNLYDINPLTTNTYKWTFCNRNVTLFSIYLDKLLGILRASNVGCRYGNHYMGAFCYADDISLLSPTVSSLQDMLKICERYNDK